MNQLVVSGDVQGGICPAEDRMSESNGDHEAAAGQTLHKPLDASTVKLYDTAANPGASTRA